VSGSPARGFNQPDSSLRVLDSRWNQWNDLADTYLDRSPPVSSG
jgi:hypothetical protein